LFLSPASPRPSSAARQISISLKIFTINISPSRGS
jgi:hypothetical protein